MKAEIVAEGVKPHNMPLSTYLPRLVTRIRRQGRRIRFQYIGDLKDEGAREAKQLALEGARKESVKKEWGFITSAVLEQALAQSSSFGSLEFEL